MSDRKNSGLGKQQKSLHLMRHSASKLHYNIEKELLFQNISLTKKKITHADPDHIRSAVA